MKTLLRRQTTRRPKVFSTWGKHLIVDAYGIEASVLRDKTIFTRLLIDLPKKLKMTIFADPTVVKIGCAECPDEFGLSGFVIIFESHIAFHTWPEHGYVSMDIYSCKEFDEHRAIQFLKEVWKTEEIKTRVMARG